MSAPPVEVGRPANQRTDSPKRVTPSAPRRRQRRRWLPIVSRDRHTIEHASCLDCLRTWRGTRTRHNASNHAGRNGHRVAFTRTEYLELRPKRFPEGKT